jgi:hypothetical protein
MPPRELPTYPQLLELKAAKLRCGYVDNSLSLRWNPGQKRTTEKSLLSFYKKRKKQRKMTTVMTTKMGHF